ncbi:S24/S26 family peptidase [Erythrobacter sp.]|uniref:S24/S26 family peptidase n=1 Tax=Erythrobacter sp. TaxID=1042 RepID=UPI001425C967|nr:S24/S26 family peptidase [Erythrobacter sp.]QIQ86693.1 MAG: hypothetical protein G9473_08340 [Erythrobacter sp.]
MVGIRLAWVPAKSMSRILPGGSLALFMKKRAYVRGDILLVRHPEHGKIVRRLHVVGRKGRYSLEPLGQSEQRLRLGPIEPEWVRGAMVCRIL